MKQIDSPRRNMIVPLIVGALFSSASCATVKLTPAERAQIGQVNVVEKQKIIAVDSGLPTHPVTGGIKGLFGGTAGGALMGFVAGSPGGPFGAAGGAGILAVVGGVMATYIGVTCGAAVAEAGINDPAGEFRRLAAGVDPARLRLALETELKTLRPTSPGSRVRPDAVLELGEVEIVLDKGKAQSEDKASCHPGISGSAKWRALRAGDGKLLEEVQTRWSQRTNAETFKEWLRDEETARMDISSFLDGLGKTIAEDLLTGRPSPR